ncbi:molybdopterin molybdotransferase MoeA [Sphingomonas canadensis]|uniref:Molybdopterin molybdenumtransferase n=1 Tax=Sphingomonas canadensis TaxID=1219257 RepID=A0ABW3HAI4_9SPHN|nr:molybdopterin molybdotransferase MoeA [Sphingomonas canadensis]MCW3837760.1 molybdopterin molybdotransferase MoeA [Sphingomonas canadensis]
MALLPVSDAQQRLLALAGPLPPERVALRAAAGRWAAEPVQALRDQPSADISAMDGYAIRFADMPGPWTVTGESAAGRAFAGSVSAGEAVRIFTGAPLPPGSDTVLVQEEAARDGAALALALAGEGPAFRGRNVRVRGLDFTTGDTLIAAGDRLTPARLALAGVAGHGMLPVRRNVRVALAATGDELVPPGAPIGDAQLPETNRAMLAAQLADLPVELIDLGILPDRAGALEAAFRALDADVLVTTGGASVGDHDLVRPALIAAGAHIDFWKIALRPGKPMMAGRLGDAVVVGLPGNPVSAFVTALLFVRPLVAHLAGAPDPFPRPRAATLGEPLPANGERTDYLRAELRDGRAYASTIQDSSMLRTLARAGCLIVRQPHAPPAAAGDSAEILDIG